MDYRKMDKTNTSYEEFEKACYELAAKEPNPVYAKEGLGEKNKRNREFI